MKSKGNTTNPAPGGTAMLGGRPVARIGFGAMQLPGPGVWGPPRNRDQALAVLRRAVAMGVNHIDTAAFYGKAVSNELIRTALYPYPDKLVLVSKVGAVRDEKAAWLPAQQPEQLRSAVEDNLRSLAVECIDVVNLRVMDRHPDGTPFPASQRADFHAQLRAMEAMREEGKIGAIGLSNVTLDHLQLAQSVGIACVQNAYSVLDRSGEPLLAFCEEHHMAWVPFFPLGSAFPGRAKVTQHPVVVQTATRLKATPAQVGLAWLLAHSDAILLIPGTAHPDHLAENVAAGAVQLDVEAISRLDGLAAKTAQAT